MKKHFQGSHKLQKKCHFQKMTNRWHLRLLPTRRHHQTLHWKLYLQNCALLNQYLKTASHKCFFFKSTMYSIFVYVKFTV